MSTKQEKVFLLRKIKYGESDLILHALTSTGAKLHFIAKGGLTSRKRFGGGILEPTHCLQVTYKEKSGREQELHILEEASLVEDFRELRKSYDRLTAAFEMLNLVGAIAQEGDGHSRDLFDLLGNTLRALQTTEHIPVLHLHFQIKALLQQGVLPPDLPYLSQFGRPIREHELINITHAELRELSTRVNYLIQNYIEKK